MLIHIVCMETCDVHGLILCVYEDLLSEKLCIHNVGMAAFVLHE